MLSFLSSFNHKKEIKESLDEILIGEIVAAMAKRNYPTIGFRADSDCQLVRFLAVDDPVLYSVAITLDRKTAGLVSAVIGDWATIKIVCETKNYLADPDDLLNMYKTDFKNLFKISFGDIKLNHQLNSVLGYTNKAIEIKTMVMKGDQGREKLSALLFETIDTIREKLRPYKKA